MNLEEIMDPSNLYVSENVTLKEYMDTMEARVRARWKRQWLANSPIRDYLDMERYCLDKVEYAEYEKLLKERETLHPCTLERMEELKKRIAAYEHEHNIIYGE